MYGWALIIWGYLQLIYLFLYLLIIYGGWFWFKLYFLNIWLFICFWFIFFNEKILMDGIIEQFYGYFGSRVVCSIYGVVVGGYCFEIWDFFL